VAPDAKGISWAKLLTIRQTWTFVVGKFLTDPIWWFFLFWLPGYFSDTFKLDLTKPGWPLVIVYSATTIGSIGGGFLSSFFILGKVYYSHWISIVLLEDNLYR